MPVLRISRLLDIRATGGTTTRGVFRHTWDGFWPQATPPTLSTGKGAIVLGDAAAYGPNIDRLKLARLALESDNKSRG
ncbi:hypothetical protein [Nonomuraea angiospora]